MIDYNNTLVCRYRINYYSSTLHVAGDERLGRPCVPRRTIEGARIPSTPAAVTVAAATPGPAAVAVTVAVAAVIVRVRMRRVRLVVHFRRVAVAVRDLWLGHHLVHGAAAGLDRTAAQPARAQARQRDRAEREQQRLAGHHHQGQRAQRYQRAARHERSAQHVVHVIVLFTCKRYNYYYYLS